MTVDLSGRRRYEERINAWNQIFQNQTGVGKVKR